MKFNKISRRSFLETSLLGASSMMLFPCIGRIHAVTNTAESANNDVRMAVIGVRSRGNNHIDDILRLKGAKLVAICDVDEKILNQRAAELDKKGVKVKKYIDMRALFDDPEIDAVSIATPNHWHSLATIWACQAGKDVYVEKPVSHNVFEGRKMIEAAIKYQRIVQAGTQCRSNPGLQEAIAWIQAGNLGAIKVARGLCYKRRASIGNVRIPQTVPSNIDYNLWCGPAPMTPLFRSQLHYDWHWVWPTGNGDLGNQGIHQMDIARWALGVHTFPDIVKSFGARYGYVDNGETPNTQIIYMSYGEKTLIFEVRGLPQSSTEGKMDALKGASIGVIVECEGGYLVNPSYTGATAYDNGGNVIKKFEGSANHFENWLQAIRSRKAENLNGSLEEAHISSALCHLGGISHRLGTPQDEKSFESELAIHPSMIDTGHRMITHLKANKIDLNKELTLVGPSLKIKPSKEEFACREANTLLSRAYRYPFIVPEKI